MISSKRIPVAYYSNGFIYGNGKDELYDSKTEEISPDEYESYMKGMIFCPACTVPLERVPGEKHITTSSKTAHFRHHRNYDDVFCAYRSSNTSIDVYSSQESVFQAIENGELSIISSWMESPPDLNQDKTKLPINSTRNIDESKGGEIDIYEGRHDGMEFKVPSVISSVRAICTQFSEKLHKYFYFPNATSPVMLLDALVSLDMYDSSWVGLENIYFGEIVDFVRLDYRDIIKVRAGVGTVDVYTDIGFNDRRNIDRDCIGRWLLVHGTLNNDSPSRIMTKYWGEYSILPKKYENAIKTIAEHKIKKI